ncbi:MAG: SPOR domain-containing protein [Rhodobacter sp.]|nr:SPOR domain-containing protein [Rhodobacter sp.]
MARIRTGRLALILCSTALVAGCSDGITPGFLKKKDAGAEVAADAARPTDSVKLVERDIEAPEVFEVSDQGLWDGRPSLGGVWVAHPSVKEPERVIIRNEENGKFVIGALFRRERDNPGPVIQVSSDAAAALGMLAGAPDTLNVTALRRQEVPIVEPQQEAPAGEAPVETAAIEAPETIETAALDPVAAASAAIDQAEADLPVTNVQPTSAPIESAPPAAPPQASKLSKPFIQIGFFSVEDNARRNGTALRNAGILPTVQKRESKGKTYWRVLAGPAPTALERSALLGKVKKLGYEDAYFVTN